MFATPTQGKRLQVKKEITPHPTSVFASQIKSTQIEKIITLLHVVHT